MNNKTHSHTLRGSNIKQSTCGSRIPRIQWGRSRPIYQFYSLMSNRNSDWIKCCCLIFCTIASSIICRKGLWHTANHKVWLGRLGWITALRLRLYRTAPQRATPSWRQYCEYVRLSVENVETCADKNHKGWTRACVWRVFRMLNN